MTRLCHLLESPEAKGHTLALELCRCHRLPERVLDGISRDTFALLGAGGLPESDFRLALRARAEMARRGRLL